MKEFMDIEGFEGFYQISFIGVVKPLERKVDNGHSIRLKKETFMNLPSNSDGYPMVQLSANGVTKTTTVHILVAKAFVPNPLNLPIVNHKDGNKRNICYKNLEWVTAQENVIHAWATGLNKSIKGEQKPQSKLKNADIPLIRTMAKEKSQRYIADYFGVTQSTIKCILKKQTWISIQ